MIARAPREEQASPPRVLVADDSPEMLGLMSAWLEERGCIVVTAGTGREALDAAAVYYPDVAFLDVVLPPPDGFAVCTALRARLAPQIIMMTGMSNPDYSRRASEMGAVTLLQKPLTHEIVIAALEMALDRIRRDPLSGLRSHFGSHPRIQ